MRLLLLYAQNSRPGLGELKNGRDGDGRWKTEIKSSTSLFCKISISLKLKSKLKLLVKVNLINTL